MNDPNRLDETALRRFALKGTVSANDTVTSDGGQTWVVAWQLGSLKVNRIGVLLKSSITPPTLSLITVPVTVAVNVAWLLPVMPCGATKVTWRVKLVL